MKIYAVRKLDSDGRVVNTSNPSDCDMMYIEDKETLDYLADTARILAVYETEATDLDLALKEVESKL